VSGSAVVFSRDLYQGVSGEDVRILQRVLNAQGYAVATSGGGSPGNETAYFGPATLAAVIRFQIAHGISPSVGYVGPITRAVFAAL
jgi:peptidoglycan hydrolase-like protein with peptidoglycan-binding domain